MLIPKQNTGTDVAAKNGSGSSNTPTLLTPRRPTWPRITRNLNAAPVSNTQINATAGRTFPEHSAMKQVMNWKGPRTVICFNKIAGLAGRCDHVSKHRTFNPDPLLVPFAGQKCIELFSLFQCDRRNHLRCSAHCLLQTLSRRLFASSQIDLAWKDNAANETSFEIERSVNGTAFDKIGEINSNGTSYQSTGLLPATRYWFRVRAKNSVNPSAYTNVADATTRDVVPNIPRSLSATAVSYQQINLAWADASGNETGFEVKFQPMVPISQSSALPLRMWTNLKVRA